MLSHEETMRLIALAQKGDEESSTVLLTENAPLLKSIIKRYLGKHVEYDDLYQIASVGLLKSIKNFSLDYNVKFSTYAVPMILGEIKRYMRDDGYLKVSRSLKSISSKITRYVDEKVKNGEESPRVEEIAKHFNIEPTEVIFAMDAAKLPISRNKKTNDSDGKQTSLIEHLPTDEDKKMVDKIILKDMLSKLQPREQKIIVLRYFRDMTQGEIAQKMGVSQVQISRLENKILSKLKSLYEEQ
ncbi:MAG: sigma-70 family RNA polymerase sigma factor [Clostridia bacterium]|nr:sigma-70 family RNA polymerase sigma factor [Clostridia bacterium]